MPYINKGQREDIDRLIFPLASLTPTTGNINYAITKFIHEIIMRNHLSYDMLNSMVGVLECAKQELYRQVAVPYEDQKKAENGPVSELDGG